MAPPPLIERCRGNPSIEVDKVLILGEPLHIMAHRLGRCKGATACSETQGRVEVRALPPRFAEGQALPFRLNTAFSPFALPTTPDCCPILLRVALKEKGI